MPARSDHVEFEKRLCKLTKFIAVWRFAFVYGYEWLTFYDSSIEFTIASHAGHHVCFITLYIARLIYRLTYNPQ